MSHVARVTGEFRMCDRGRVCFVRARVCVTCSGVRVALFINLKCVFA